MIVRDCRDCQNPNQMFQEVIEHLKIATGGDSIQSVMSVFRPQRRNEMWGLRFFNSQFVRYAGYIIDEESGETLGDPANVAFTKYLIEQKLWSPPTKKSAFDILPIVIKEPGNNIPFVFSLPREVAHEVNLEHPTNVNVNKLGFKWVAVPAITNFMMNLGGIKYPCCPFNGWFVSTEIVRNLIERYNATEAIATALDIDLNDRLLKQAVFVELEKMVLYSFDKNSLTIVDPMSVGDSFMMHCKKERREGRDCPAQWSWIGGLVGMY